MIVQRLRAIQNEHGYLPDDELRKLAREIGVPLYRLEEVASFFPAFRQERNKPAYVEVMVCRDMACHHRGAAKLLSEKGLPRLAAELSQKTGKTVHVEGVSCLGRCDRAPSVWVERHPDPSHEHAWVYNARNTADLESIVSAIAAGEPRPEPDWDATYPVNSNVGTDPLGAPRWDINVYNSSPDRPPYDAVRSYIAWTESHGGQPMPPMKRLAGKELNEYAEKHHPFLWQMQVSTLLGMGGAGMPTYQKWIDVWQQAGPEKYIVSNGDESEPGTFKDREIMLRLPHLLVEGVILAGLVTGATGGYIYIRHEYPEEIAACKRAIEEAKDIGACGEGIFGSSRNFPVEVFESPGGYICGEQSALLEAMEDRRSQPRNRPPELTSNGLRDRPTVVNNIETLAWAPYIAIRGGKSYAEGGWKVPGTKMQFAGRRLFSVSGDVNRPGVYEVPIGLPIGDLLNKPEYCGGLLGGRALKAMATSGPSGGLLPAQIPFDPKLREGFAKSVARIRERSQADGDLTQWFLDTHLPPGATHLSLEAVPLELNFFRNLHSILRLPVEPMLGAGMVVYAEGTDTLDTAVVFSRFFRNESCGKCVPCRLGSTKLYQIGEGLIQKRAEGTVPAFEVEAVKRDVNEMTKTMQQTSICGLGYVAPIPLASALAYFPDEVSKAPKAGR